MYARSHARLLLPALAIALLAGGCDKNSNPATPADAAPAARDGDAAAPEPAAAATEPGAPGVTWADKTFKQRQEHMGIVFFPKMKKMFKAHDETTYKGFKCQTCHGDDMKERNFAMPTDSIFPLDPNDPITASMDYDEEVTKFMMEQVVPEAAAMLDMEPFNPETGQGFGCFGCHPTE
ncbi:MAG: hypothetical protein AAGA54_24955 [Myxococcota bacterium]